MNAMHPPYSPHSLSQFGQENKGIKPTLAQLPLTRSEKLFLREGFVGALQAIFLSIVTLGILPVYALCVSRLDELTENTNTMSGMGIDYSEQLAPLYALNRVELHEVKKIFEALNDHSERILETLKNAHDDNLGEVVLHEFDSNAGIRGARIVAKGGAICFTQNDNQSVTSIPLIKITQLLVDWKEIPRVEALNLKDQDLSHLRMSNAKLNKAILQNVNMSHTDWRNADFTDATLEDINLCGAELEGAILNVKDAKIKMALPKIWDEATLKDYFKIARKSTDPRNLFTAIKSIDSEYKDLKINLIHQIIGALKNTATTCVKDDLVFLVMDPIYWKDEKIRLFRDALL